MKRILSVSIVFLAANLYFCNEIFAQQIQYGNQYLINKYSLNPAYTGNSGYFQAFANYRQSWVGVTGSPESRGVNVNSAFMQNMGLGGSIQSEQSGIFRNSTANLSYAYHLKLNDAHLVSFGLSAGVLQNNTDLSGSKSLNSGDPIITNNQNVSSMLFDADFGLMYRFKNLNVGIAIPHLVPSAAKNDAGTFYTLKMHQIIHLSYSYDINKDWNVEPFVVLRNASTGMFYEVSALGKYKDWVFAGITYRKESVIAANIGGNPFNNISLMYSYEFSANGMMGQSSGTHEISLGYFFGKNKNAVAPSDSKKPYYDWLNK